MKTNAVFHWVLGIVTLAVGQARAVNGSWNAGSGDWATSTNWVGSPDPVPGGVGSIVNFEVDSFASRTINLGGERTVGELNIGLAARGPYTWSGGSFRFDNGLSNAKVNFTGTNSQTIGVAVTLNSSLDIDSSGDNVRTLSGSITAGGADEAKVLTHTVAGTGPMQLTGVISDGAGNRTLSLHQISGGTMVLRGANTFSGGVRVSDGTVLVEGAVVSAQALGTGTLTLDGGNLGFLYTAPLNLGNNTAILADTSITVGNRNSGTTGRVFTLGALSVGNHVVSVSNTGSGSTMGSDTMAFGSTTLTGNTTFDVESVASVPTELLLGALNGASDLTKSGDGILRLNSAAGTYAGTTVLQEGTLIVGNNMALGSGELVVSGADAATLQIGSGITTANAITFSNTNSGSVVERTLASSTAFGTGTSNAFGSAFDGGKDTSAEFLAGNTSAATTLAMRFSPTASATNDANRISDIFSLSGTGTDVFVLELSLGMLEGDPFFLGILSAGEWVSATTGISGGALAGQYAMSWSSFTAEYGAFNATTMLGAYGYDTTTGSAWAVLNQGNDLAIITAIPEPSQQVLLAIGLLFLILWQKRRNASRLG